MDVAIRDGGNAGADADIDITAVSGDFSFQATRNFVIPAASTVKEIEPTVTATGNSGKYEFELENKGSTTVTLTEIGVVQTTANNVVKVGGKNNDDIFRNVSTGNPIVNNVITVGGSREPLTTTVDLAPGSSNAIKFEFDRFRDGQDKNGNMNGEDVRIDVAFSDGSSTTLDLCVGGSCSFASTPTPTPTNTPTTTGTATTTPSNQPPTADFNINPGKNKNFKDLNAAPSSDPDGSINKYEWDTNNDGTYDSMGQTVQGIKTGTTVTLRVTDNDGATDTTSKTV